MDDPGGTDRGRSSVRFEPMRPASRTRLVVGFVLGPVLWLVALSAAAWRLDDRWAITVGLLVAAVSLLASVLGLAILYGQRRRRERRYADGG